MNILQNQNVFTLRKNYKKMKLTYKGKSAIVTGACGGMGLEVSKNLSRNNITVLMIDLKKHSV